ncbi:MAG: ABC transporter permease subunit [Candidatus Hydrogenedentes bacterium]|jgi:ABC-type transport system involved in multi-copper enzyme maturation permease subunit|nr:ABC transporter permease subunit [Candidatus Hydrogenedentota bacterium]
MRILAIAQNTFRESIRDKVLYVLLFFAAVTIFGSKALGWISIGQDIKIVKDIALASTSVFGVLIAIFVGTSLIYKEIDKRTLYTILAQPMHRYEFIVGKYLGLIALLAVTTVIMAVVSSLYILLLGGTLHTTFFLAILLIYWKLMLITAFAVLMSAMTSPILGAIIVFSVAVFGHATEVFRDLPPQFDGTAAKAILEAAYYVIPNLSNFDIAREAANGIDVSPAYVIWVMTYGLMYTVMLLILAALAFQEKDV